MEQEGIIEDTTSPRPGAGVCVGVEHWVYTCPGLPFTVCVDGDFVFGDFTVCGDFIFTP